MNKKKTNVIFLTVVLFSLFIFSSQVLAQSKGSIKGIVTDKSTGETLIGTNVFLDGTGFGAASDIDGNFILTNIPVGEYKLRVSYIGYQEQNFTIKIEANKTLNLEVELGFSGALETEDVVVTAQAKGQMSAINEQLSSQSIKNVVSAEKLQELPDANAAESVGRLPGVSVLRSGGEGNKVVVRGLSPKYNKITIEGVSMSSTGQDRSTDISMISPYSLDGIEVIKAATADHDADFIGGLINFKLREADPGWKFDLVSQGGYNNLKSTYSDYIINGSISNRFLDDDLGVYFQGNIERRNRSSNQLSAGYEVENNAVIGKNNSLFIQNLKLTDAIREKSRLGATLVLDYKLNDGVIHLKNFYSSSGTSINRYNEIFNPVDRRRHSYEALDEQYDLSTLSNILDYEQRFGNFKVDAKVSHSSSGNESPGNLWFQFNQIGALDASVQDDAIAPSEIYNFATINDAKTTFDFAKETSEKTIEQQLGASMNFQYDFSVSKQINGNIKIGGKYRFKDRSYDRNAYGSDMFIGSAGPTNEAIRQAFPEFQHLAAEQQIPYSLISKSLDHMNFLEGEYSMGEVADLELMRRIWNVLKENGRVGGNYGYIEYERTSNTYDYSGTEDYNAGYIMSEINFGSNVKFIPGLRYEKNTTTYKGVKGFTNIAYAEQYYQNSDTTVTRNNDFLLPMVHLKYTPFDWFDVRLAYTQTLSRPNYNLIMPRMDVFAKNVSWNNYDLKPERSENLDIYLSFHENYLGLFTVGVFKKTIKDMIFNLGQRVIIDPTEYNLSDDYKFDFIYTFENNQHTADVNGIELDWQTNFWYLPGALKGIVFSINYTHINSEAKYPISFPKIIQENPLDPPTYDNIDSSYTSQLIDQPDDIINIQIGYDYADFSARLSMLYQSKIFKKAEFWPEESQFADEYLRWDITAKQKLPWYGIQLFLNLNNISSALDRDLVKGAKWDASIQHYGMTVDFGLRIKM